MAKIQEKFDTLPYELRKLGLNKKEADVYLFLLAREYATAVGISKELALSRPTVYRVIEELIKKELVFSDKDKKSRFSANSPDSFPKVLRIKRRQVEEQEREFLRIISVLKTKYHLLSKKNEIKFYQKKTLLEDFASTDEKEIYVFCANSDSADCKKINRKYSDIRKRLGKISIKEISAQKTPSAKLDYVERKTFGHLSRWNGTLIVTDKIFIFDKKRALSIEEESAVEVMKMFFEIIWKTE